MSAVTSTILVSPSFFTYRSGIYVPDAGEEIIGSLEVTIIGWGRKAYNISTNPSSKVDDRFWIVIQHLGRDFGASLGEIQMSVCTETSCYRSNRISDWNSLSSCSSKKGFMMIHRRFDALGIESNAVGAVPVSFVGIKKDPNRQYANLQG